MTITAPALGLGVDRVEQVRDVARQMVLPDGLHPDIDGAGAASGRLGTAVTARGRAAAADAAVAAIGGGRSGGAKKPVIFPPAGLEH